MEETKVLLDDSMFEKLDDSEKNTEFIAMESKTYLQDAWRCFKKNKLALGGLVFLSIMILLAIFVPMVSPYTYDAQDLDLRNALPSASHLLGTDKLGRDILVRLMFGARISLAVGFVAAFLNLIIGVVYGGISGFVGGKVDMVMMRIIDCIYSIPSMLYVILILLDDSMFEKLDDSEKNTEFIAMESKTYLQDAWRCFKKNKLALGGLVFLSVMILLAIFVPMVSPYTYDAQDLDLRNALPSASHLLGTDKLGRDILVRLMFGARISLAVGFVAAFLNLIIGVVYGGISGFVGGKVDMVMMRIIDCIYSIPSMLYVILIMMVFGSNIGSVLLGICVSSWIGMARQVRTQVQTLKQQEFALAAYVIGAGKLRILFKHLIINCMGPIIVSTTLMVPEAIFTESFLAFIGIGISLPQASWGTLASEARSVIQSYPLQIVWPVLAICLTVLSLNFIGDGVGEALDPKNR